MRRLADCSEITMMDFEYNDTIKPLCCCARELEAAGNTAYGITNWKR
jgi:hypothetical protein